MKTAIAAFLAAALPAAAMAQTNSGGAPLEQQTGKDKPPLAENRFSDWLIFTQESLSISIPVMGLVQAAQPRERGQTLLARYILADDDLLKRYLNRIDKTRRKFGTVNPYDLQLIGAMRNRHLEAKKELLSRLEKTADELGVKEDRPASTSEALPAVAGLLKPGAMRYDAEWDGMERWDGSAWIPVK